MATTIPAKFTKALSTMGKVTAQTRAIALELLEHADRKGHPITVVWGAGGGTEHGSGRALDLMTFKDKAAGDLIAAYLWEHRERLGLRHYIWQQAIRSTVKEPGKVRPMADRGNSTKNHRDHVHVWFDAKPYTAPAKPKPKPAAKPKPAPRRVVIRRQLKVTTPQTYGTDVKAVQRKLGLKADGYYGPVTARAVYGFQSRWFADRNEWDGAVGPKTARALGFDFR